MFQHYQNIPAGVPEDKRLDSMDKRLNGMDNRLEGLDTRLRTLDGKVESVRAEVKLHNELLAPFINWSHRIEDSDPTLGSASGFTSAACEAGEPPGAVGANASDLSLCVRECTAKSIAINYALVNVAIPFGQPESHSRYPTTTRIRSIPNTLNVPLRHRTLTRPDYVAGGKR